MPIKTCVCDVCHAVVPKASTSHVGDGKRACKSHPDTGSRAQAALRKMEKPPVDQLPPLFGRPETFADVLDIESEARRWADKQCWLCGCEGVFLGEDYEMLLTAFARLGWKPEDFASFRPETAAAVREEGRRRLGVLLHRPKLPIDPSKRGPILDKASRRPTADRVVAEIGFVQVCGKCAERYGLDVAPELRGPDVLATLGLLLVIRSAHQKAREKTVADPGTEGSETP